MGRLAFMIRMTVPIAMLVFLPMSISAQKSQQWESPFPTESPPASDSIDLDMALYRVAMANHRLRSTGERKAGISGLLRQSNRWPNPEFEMEVEEFGGSLPGFSGSEWTFALAQEFELWGKRGARKKAAEAEAGSITLEADIAAFDIYAETSMRYYELVHAQTRHALVQKAQEVALNMVESSRNLVDKGASLVSELRLAELQLARIEMDLDGAEVELSNAKMALAALWNGQAADIKAVSQRNQNNELPDVASLMSLVDRSRDMVMAGAEQALINARINSAGVETKPSIELRAGIKRLEADKTNTFLMGVALPLPLFDRNKGELNALHAQAVAVESERNQIRTQTETDILAAFERARILKTKLTTLEQEVIPKAEETSLALREAYRKGRLPYMTMLEGERTVLDLQHEHNDTLLDLRREIISLEKILGIKLSENIENIEDKP
jgi:cobalt-zinc-cadmium efflux system outer membrane protein